MTTYDHYGDTPVTLHSRRIPVNSCRQLLDQLGETINPRIRFRGLFSARGFILPLRLDKPINALVRRRDNGLGANLRVNERGDLLFSVDLGRAELVDPIHVRVEALAVVLHKARKRHESGFKLCDSFFCGQLTSPLSTLFQATSVVTFTGDVAPTRLYFPSFVAT